MENKQIILYTYEQVIDILTSGSFPYDSDEIDEILSEYTPIKLPSDEEIHDKGRYSTSINGFLEGGLWVIKKIKQQDK